MGEKNFTEYILTRHIQADKKNNSFMNYLDLSSFKKAQRILINFRLF